MKRAQLVAIGIAKVSKIHWAGTALANARWVLDRLAAVRDSGVVPSGGLFRARHREADSAAVGVAGRLAIDGFAHHEQSAVMQVKQPALGVLPPGLTADRAKQGIVELLRPGETAASATNRARFTGREKHRRIDSTLLFRLSDVSPVRQPSGVSPVSQP
jgi:hypothetical protein